MSKKHSTLINPDQLATSFVPEILRWQYANNPDRNTGDPLKEDHAALLWIDVCNFSPLSNRLMKDTVSGVEKLTGILQSHYDFVLSTITEYGGQPLFFAGDGLMSAWPGDKKKAQDSVQLAAACAYKIINKRSTLDDKNELLSIHALVSVGPWQIAELEGIHGNSLVSFFGDVFNDLTLASKNKAPNQVLISNAALAFVNEGLRSKPVEYATSILLDAPAKFEIPELSDPYLTEDAIQKLKSFTPRTLAFPLNRERLKWIAEIRPVTILFVRLPNSSKSSAVNLNQLRESVGMTAPLVLKYDGLLNQTWIDEKESNMMICFGPPPSAHIDNPERSVRLALEIHNLLNNSGFENSVAVSSGMAYCGILGNDILRQYTVIGEVVNLSAHLTGIRKNSIFCDKTTYSSTNKVIKYIGPVMEKVKGRTEPASLYIPEGLLGEGLIKSNIAVSIGRKNEFAGLVDACNRASQGETTCVIIEGESGMGKSKLLEDFKTIASSESVRMVAGSGDFVSRNTPYAAIRTIVLSLLEIKDPESEKNQNEICNDLVTRFGQRACLLNIVLNTSIPDSDAIRNLTGSQRVQATHSLLLKLLMDESWKQPLVLIIDDAQWMDEASWKLIESVKDNVTHCLVVLSLQITEVTPQVQRFKEQGAETIVLKELTNEDLEALVCAKLGVSSISQDVADLVSRTSKGNPFFCTELAESLAEHELLLFENDSCSLVKDMSTKEFSLPETVRGAIRRRIDRLGQGSQLSLKVGSVVGNRFAKKIACSIYPIATERKAVPSYLNELGQFGFLNETMVDNLNGYIFNHATTAEVAYEMILAGQRRQLHRKSAEWYEKNFRDNLQPFYVRLANHWIQAGDIIKASEYLEQECNKLVSAGFTKQAIELGVKGINLFNINIDPGPSLVGQRIGETMEAIAGLMENKTIQSLSGLKQLDDAKTERLIVMLTHIGPYTYIGGRLDLFVLLSVLGLKITLENGNAEATADVYSMYSIVHRGITGDSRAAFDWSRLAIEIDNKHGGQLHPRVAHVHAWFLNHWILPLSETFPVSRGGIDAGLASGDIMFACFNLAGYIVFMAAAGRHLDEVIETGRKHFAINNMRVVNAAFHIVLEMQVAKALKGTTTGNTQLTDKEFDETKDVASILDTEFTNQKGFYYIAKLKLHTHFGEWEEALKWAENIPPIYPYIAHQIGEIEFEWFQAISFLYRAAETTGQVKADLLTGADAGIKKIYGWADVCSHNFLHKAMMLDAIKEGLFGDANAATNLFEKAAVIAGKNDFINDKALILEHLLRMQHRLGLKKMSLDPAIEAWKQLGAYGKAKYVTEQFG